MPDYLMLKHAHAGFAYLTVLSFAARGLMMAAKPAWLVAKPVRIAPHLIDTLLLACAIALLVVGQLNPLHIPWLQAKIVALLVYIGLGTVALKRGKTPAVRWGAFFAALATVLYIVAVAKTKLVWPF